MPCGASGELSDGSGTRLDSDQGRRPPRSGCAQGAVWSGINEGVSLASLL
jgi:hypothetical protein